MYYYILQLYDEGAIDDLALEQAVVKRMISKEQAETIKLLVRTGD